MLRNFLSVIAGVVAGSVLFFTIQLFNYLLVPIPEGQIDLFSLSTKEFVDTMTYPAWTVVIASYIVGSFVAGFISGKLAESTTLIFPLFVSIFFMLGWFVRITAVPRPLWVGVAVMLLFVPSTLAGHRLAVDSRESA